MLPAQYLAHHEHKEVCGQASSIDIEISIIHFNSFYISEGTENTDFKKLGKHISVYIFDFFKNNFYREKELISFKSKVTLKSQFPASNTTC